MAHHSHYGLILLLGPMLVFLPVGGVIVWAQNYWRPLILVAGLLVLWWQMVLGNGALFWLHRLRGHSRQPVLCTLCPQKGTWPVMAQMLLTGTLGQIPEMMINIEGEDMAPLSVTLAVVTGIFTFWIYVRLLLVPVLTRWYEHGWKSWSKSWHMTKGSAQWTLAAQLLAGILPCCIGAALIQHFSARPHLVSIMDLFILPFVQMILMLIITLWPLTIAAAFCYSREQPKGK